MSSLHSKPSIWGGKNSDPGTYFKVNLLQNQNSFTIKQSYTRKRRRASRREGTFIKTAVGKPNYTHTHTLTNCAF